MQKCYYRVYNLKEKVKEKANAKLSHTVLNKHLWDPLSGAVLRDNVLSS